MKKPFQRFLPRIPATSGQEKPLNPNSEIGFREGNKANEGRTLSVGRSAVRNFSCTLVVPRRFQWNGLATPPSNPHPGGMPEVSRGLSVRDTPGGDEQTGPHPGGVPEPPGRPFSGTPAGVRQPGVRMTGGIAALNPRLISSIPPGWRYSGRGDFHSTENVEKPVECPSGTGYDPNSRKALALARRKSRAARGKAVSTAFPDPTPRRGRGRNR